MPPTGMNRFLQQAHHTWPSGANQESGLAARPWQMSDTGLELESNRRQTPELELEIRTNMMMSFPALSRHCHRSDPNKDATGHIYLKDQ